MDDKNWLNMVNQFPARDSMMIFFSVGCLFELKLSFSIEDACSFFRNQIEFGDNELKVCHLL